MENYNIEQYGNRISLYLAKLLNPDEVIAFKKEMEANPVLKREVEAQEFGQAFEFLSIKANLREDLAKIKEKELVPEELENQNGRIIFLWKKTLRIAAAAVLIIGGYFGFQMYKEYQLSELVSGYVKNSKSTRSGVPVELKEGTAAYEKGEINKAKILLEKMPMDSVTIDPDEFGASIDSSETASYRNFYNGLISLNESKWNEAIMSLQKVDGTLQYEAQWYMAIAYIKNGEIDKAKIELDSIIKNPNEAKFRSEAEKLLKEIK
jgi:tetratricopeptide (TPR) repeat protein